MNGNVTVIKCPVCDWTGLVSRPPHVPGDAATWTDSRTGPYECRACAGTGVLFVNAHRVLGEPWDSGLR